MTTYRHVFSLYAAGFHVGDALEVLAKARRFLRSEPEAWKLPSRRHAYALHRELCMKKVGLP